MTIFAVITFTSTVNADISAVGMCIVAVPTGPSDVNADLIRNPCRPTISPANAPLHSLIFVSFVGR